MTERRQPQEIEAEIAATRAELDETLAALEARLAPRYLLEKGFDMMRDGMNGNMGRIGQALREHPIPLALIGAGLGWLVLSRTGAAQQAGEAASEAAGAVGERVRGMIRRGEHYAHAWTKHDEPERYARDLRRGAGRAYDAASEAAREGYGRASEAGRRAYDRAAEMGERAYDAIGDAAERAAGAYRRHARDPRDYRGYAERQLGHARDRVSQLMEDYPLAVGALGFLAGAVFAAALPSTRWEDEHLGDARDDVLRGARAAGRDMVDRAKDVASTAASAASDAIKDTADATKDEAERQGFLGDGDKGR
jgi:hypothetical protein